MDRNQFNDLVKSIALGNSRRSVLKGLVGGLVAGVFGLGARQDAEAARGPGLTCKEDEDCVENATCVQVSPRRKKCACNDGYRKCRGKCIPDEECCNKADCGGLNCCGGTCCGLPCIGGVCIEECVDNACFDECVSVLCFGVNGTKASIGINGGLLGGILINGGQQLACQVECAVGCAAETCLESKPI